MDKKRKAITKIFKDIGFSINIQTNLKEIDFLDVTLNLQNYTYRSYKKPNNKLLLHPLIIENIHRKSSNSYQIPSLKDKKFFQPRKFQCSES